SIMAPFPRALTVKRPWTLPFLVAMVLVGLATNAEAQRTSVNSITRTLHQAATCAHIIYIVLISHVMTHNFSSERRREPQPSRRSSTLRPTASFGGTFSFDDY